MSKEKEKEVRIEMHDEEDTDRSYKQLFADFASNTTAHGFGQIVLTENIPIKIFWILTLMACHVALYFQIQPLILNYLRKPTSTHIYLESEDQADFPVIVVCNENSIKTNDLDALFLDLANVTEYVDSNFYTYGNTTTDYHYHSYYNDSWYDWSSWSYSHQSYLESDNDYQVDQVVKDKYSATIDALVALNKSQLFEYGIGLKELVKSCSWKYKECLSEKAMTYWTKFWHWKYGACHVFNSGFLENGTENEVLKVTHSGPDNALTLTLFINHSEYNPNVTDSAGIRFYVGDQGVFYSPFSKGYSLSPGSSYFIGLDRKKIIRVDPFRNGSCRMRGTVRLQSSVTQNVLTKYSTEFCKYECLAKTQLKFCGCIEYFLPKISENRTCISDREQICASNSSADFDAHKGECLQKCTPPCNEVQYTPQISMQMYPNSNFEKANSLHYFDASASGKDDYLKVSFYYKSTEIEVWENLIVYGIVNLLADIGGQLGLFSGYSVFTIIEFLFFFFYVAAHTVYFIVPKRRMTYQS